MIIWFLSLLFSLSILIFGVLTPHDGFSPGPVLKKHSTLKNCSDCHIPFSGTTKSCTDCHFDKKNIAFTFSSKNFHLRLEQGKLILQ